MDGVGAVDPTRRLPPVRIRLPGGQRAIELMLGGARAQERLAAEAGAAGPPPCDLPPGVFKAARGSL